MYSGIPPRHLHLWCFICCQYDLLFYAIDQWQKDPYIQEMRNIHKELVACRELIEKACGQVGNHTEEEIKCSKLKRDFADIVEGVFGWLRNRYPEAENAAVWHNETLKDFQSEPIAVQNDYPTIFEQLQKRWSFTNTGTLQQLVKETIELNSNMDLYKIELSNQCNSIIESKKAMTKKVILEPYDANKPRLVLKITSIAFFNDVEVCLKKVFGTYKRYLTIHKIEPGCATMQFDGRIKPQLQACISSSSKKSSCMLKCKYTYQS